MAEHSSAYEELFKHLTEQGLGIWAWDFRGHGRSDGKRGYGRHLDDFHKDLNLFFTKIVAPQIQNSGKPLFMFGHSMGGLITLKFALEDQPDITALVLSSPCLGLTVQVPEWKATAAKIANQFAPKITMYNEIKYTDLSRDPQMQETYRKDAFRHDKISPGIFLSMLELFPKVAREVGFGKYPLLMQLAGDDRIVDAHVSQEFFSQWPNTDKTLHIYKDNLHEIYNDLDKKQVIADLDQFLQKFIKG